MLYAICSGVAGPVVALVEMNQCCMQYVRGVAGPVVTLVEMNQCCMQYAAVLYAICSSVVCNMQRCCWSGSHASGGEPVLYAICSGVAGPVVALVEMNQCCMQYVRGVAGPVVTLVEMNQCCMQYAAVLYAICSSVVCNMQRCCWSGYGDYFLRHCAKLVGMWQYLHCTKKIKRQLVILFRV